MVHDLAFGKIQFQVSAQAPVLYGQRSVIDYLNMVYKIKTHQICTFMSSKIFYVLIYDRYNLQIYIFVK